MCVCVCVCVPLCVFLFRNFRVSPGPGPALLGRIGSEKCLPLHRHRNYRHPKSPGRVVLGRVARERRPRRPEVVGGRVGEGHAAVRVVVGRGGRGGRLGGDVGRVGDAGVLLAWGPGGEEVVRVLGGGVGRVVAAVHHLPHLLLLLLVDVVGELGLFVPGGGHPLVRRGRDRRRVGGVETGLEFVGVFFDNVCELSFVEKCSYLFVENYF